MADSSHKARDFGGFDEIGEDLGDEDVLFIGKIMLSLSALFLVFGCM
jgi:hypothetical protein